MRYVGRAESPRARGASVKLSGLYVSPDRVMSGRCGRDTVAAMDGVTGSAVVIVGGIWVATVLMLLLGLGASRQTESPSRRQVLLTVADEYLSLVRQAEHPIANADETLQRAAVLLQVLRSQMADDSMALHHAEAMLSMLNHSDRDHGPRMDYHRAMFADAVWNDVDPVPKSPMAKAAFKRSLSHGRHPQRNARLRRQ